MEQTQPSPIAYTSAGGGSRRAGPGLAGVGGPKELAASGRQVDMVVARLVRAGNPAGMVTRFVASVHDGL